MIRSLASATYFLQVVESIVTSLIVLIAFLAPGLASRQWDFLEAQLANLSRRPLVSFASLVVGLIIVRLMLLPLLPIPSPAIHDEFSYLLAAQTFAAGRITNVPSSFWPNFESVHVLQQPTYMSMYPPGQGLLLALGIVLVHQAWFGVLLCTAVLCGALFWALKGWVPPEWALAGALLAAVRWCLPSYWMNSYWGGSLPALGGALLFGSVPRLAQKPSLLGALCFVLGLVVLANTRPYEGLVLALLFVGLLLACSTRQRTLRQLVTPIVLVPCLLVASLAALGMLYYNSRITHSPTTLPYAQDRQEYAIAPLFIWQSLRPEPVYNSPSLRQVYRAEVSLYRQARAKFGIPELLRKLKNMWVFFAGPLLSIPLFFFLFLPADSAASEQGRRVRLIRIILAIVLLASSQVVWLFPHYLAPAFAPFLCCLVIGFARLRYARWNGRGVGVALSRGLAVGCVLVLVLPVFARALHWRLTYWPLQWAVGTPRDVQSPEIVSRLLAQGRRALVFVNYGPNHDPGNEWVYNSPTIVDSPVIWARPTNLAADLALIRHFSDREVWIVSPDSQPVGLTHLGRNAPSSVLESIEATR